MGKHGAWCAGVAGMVAALVSLLPCPAVADGLGGGGGTDPVCCIVPPDSTPDPFDFADLDGVMPGVTVTSAPVTLTGFDEAMIWPEGGDMDIGCDGSFEAFQGNEGPPVVTTGSTVCVRHEAAPTCGTATTTTLHVGDSTAAFTTTTLTVADGCVSSFSPRDSGGALPLWLVVAGLVLARRRRGA